MTESEYREFTWEGMTLHSRMPTDAHLAVMASLSNAEATLRMLPEDRKQEFSMSATRRMVSLFASILGPGEWELIEQLAVQDPPPFRYDQLPALFTAAVGPWEEEAPPPKTGPRPRVRRS